MAGKLLIPMLAAACWAVAGDSVRADSDGDEAGAPRSLDCDHLPPTAVTRLPAPFDEWAHLDCLPLGQRLVEPRGWIWRYPASFTTQVIVPAWTPDPAAAATGARYFTAATASVTHGEAAAALHERLAKEVDVYASMTSERPIPSAVYTLSAMNDLAQETRVHFVYRSDQDIWAIVCAPNCRPEYSFLVSSRGDQAWPRR